jgi:hypothetical protein
LDDYEIDDYITGKIEERDITLYDILGERYIDPNPEDKTRPSNKRARWNRFSSLTFEHRLCELLTESEFDPDLPYNNLAIPMKGLVRYWWNNIADQEGVIELVFDGILTYHKDRMLPEEPEEEPADIFDAFDELLGAV